MASTGGQQPVPTPPTAVPAATSTTTHEIQAQNPNAHLSTSSTNPTQNLPPHPPSLSTFANTTTTTTTTTSSFNGGKKRPLDYGGLLQSSPYFKMRLLVKDLRPLVLEVEFLLSVSLVSRSLQICSLLGSFIVVLICWTIVLNGGGCLFKWVLVLLLPIDLTTVQFWL